MGPLVADSNILGAGSLTSGLTNNRFSHYQSLQRQTMLFGPMKCEGWSLCCQLLQS